MSPAIWVLYDETCGFCCACADWLRTQDKVLPLTCLPRGGEVSKRVFTGLPWGHDELVVIDSAGGVYRGGDAFVMALWALQAFRPWAERAAKEPLRSRARSLFHWLSSRRQQVSNTLGLQAEAQLVETLDRSAPQGCEDDQCAVSPSDSSQLRRPSLRG